MNLKNKIADKNQSESSRLYFKILEKNDGLNGINTVPVNAGFGIHAKRTMSFKSLKRRYMAMPAMRDKSDSKP
jgi:hypothetical protein